jgi:XTP/dITP diphosphohydrolase
LNSLVFASNNPAKIALVKRMFAPLPIKIKAQEDHGVPDVTEDKPTFFENALCKARNACLHTNLPALADDSGLIVPSLGNQPGVRTRRYAGEGKTIDQAIQKLLTELKGKTRTERQAKFICTMVYLRHASDPTPLFVQHELIGEISEQPQGQGIYGFDTIFYLPLYKTTFAQLAPSIQDSEDPRRHALKQLVDHLK